MSNGSSSTTVSYHCGCRSVGCVELYSKTSKNISDFCFFFKIIFVCLCIMCVLLRFPFTITLMFQSFEAHRSSQVSTGSSQSERSSYGDFTHSHSHGALNLMDL